MVVVVVVLMVVPVCCTGHVKSNGISSRWSPPGVNVKLTSFLGEAYRPFCRSLMFLEAVQSIGVFDMERWNDNAPNTYSTSPTIPVQIFALHEVLEGKFAEPISHVQVIGLVTSNARRCKIAK